VPRDAGRNKRRPKGFFAALFDVPSTLSVGGASLAVRSPAEQPVDRSSAVHLTSIFIVFCRLQFPVPANLQSLASCRPRRYQKLPRKHYFELRFFVVFTGLPFTTDAACRRF